MHLLENEFLCVKINAKGAELRSIYNKIAERELLWQADPAYWGKFSPLLFPIVGALRGDKYIYEGKTYNLSRHGFARDKKFNILCADNSQIVFELISEENSKNCFPFDFSLRVKYSLEGKKLEVKYVVTNPSSIEDLYFSIGGHPAFSVGTTSDEFAEYRLIFNNDEFLKTTLLQDNLLQEQEVIIQLNEKKLTLDYKLFERDALVISNMNSDEIILAHRHKGNVFQFSFENFPYFGIWTVIGANFICLEPWAGVADEKHHNQQLTLKKGINKLEPLRSWGGKWNLMVF